MKIQDTDGMCPGCGQDADHDPGECPGLVGHLQAAGYEPGEDGWCDLTASGTGTIRVDGALADTGEIMIHFMDEAMACEWSARFAGAPDSVIMPALLAAEAELAERRGGPVTPAQAEYARLLAGLPFPSETVSTRRRGGRTFVSVVHEITPRDGAARCGCAAQVGGIPFPHMRALHVQPVTA